ncbi:HNH endonuclease [Paraburkholderia caribensis]|uniref:HNH endonuclease n=1 Tax=Paraburkholderia caribensis TaxID=75105 RepID=UPI001CAEE4F7|nr:HNH endonuclease [Paraburkholderia caribensis]CAG9243850.1 conserved hypothetical protein [Paraburkholderia caribensis]
MTPHSERDGMRERLRKELAEYLARPHRTKKYREDARATLSKFFRETRNGKDGWVLLESLDKANGDTVTGSELKAALRDQLVKIQSNRCCYCRRWLVNTAYARPIEHILPRAHFRKFSLHFWNLALACTDCNTLKSDKLWGTVNPKRRSYPQPNEINDWYHPRFHVYDQHIRFIRLESNGTTFVVFLGLTKQGRTLCKSLLRHIAAKEMLISNNATLSSCMATLDEYGDRFNTEKAEKLRDFQNELSASVVRMIKT